MYSGNKIEFWSGSNVVRVNGSVFPLPSAVFFEDGHWWGESNSSLAAMRQFLTNAGRPSDLNWSPQGEVARQSANVPIAPKIESAPKTVPTPSGGSSSSILVSRVRWGEQVDAYRAVVDISAQTDVDVKEYPGKFEVTFSGVSTQKFNDNSPWSPLGVEARQSGGNVLLTFNHTAAKVKSFWVQEPWRYVVDFYFGGTPAPNVLTRESEQPAKSASSTINTLPSASLQSRGKYLVVVDAGHGGHDPGAIGNGLKEKDINLKAVLELASSLKNIGLDVKMTRGDDRYLKLGERTALANEANADVFISLHCNALPKGQHASGMELYLMDQPTDRAAFNLAVLENKELDEGTQNTAEGNAAADAKTQLLMKIMNDMLQNDKLSESTTLAEFMYNKARAAGFPLRKVRQAPLFVLRGAEMPALLVEMAYITEAKDAKNLTSQAYRKKMMDSIAAGILEYLKSGPVEGGH
jgi:N-acetylmuramoyl-L-alanine amidase